MIDEKLARYEAALGQALESPEAARGLFAAIAKKPAFQADPLAYARRVLEQNGVDPDAVELEPAPAPVDRAQSGHNADPEPAEPVKPASAPCCCCCCEDESENQPSDEEDFTIETAPPKPLIEPGQYFAKSNRVSREASRWGGHKLRIGFTVFASDPRDGNGEVRATGLEWFANLKPGKQGASSKVARLLQLLPGTAGSASAARLRNQLWRVDVETISRGAKGKPVPAYSVIAHVSEFLSSAGIDSSSG